MWFFYDADKVDRMLKDINICRIPSATIIYIANMHLTNMRHETECISKPCRISNRLSFPIPREKRLFVFACFFNVFSTFHWKIIILRFFWSHIPWTDFDKLFEKNFIFLVLHVNSIEKHEKSWKFLFFYTTCAKNQENMVSKIDESETVDFTWKNSLATINILATLAIQYKLITLTTLTTLTTTKTIIICSTLFSRHTSRVVLHTPDVS